MPGKDIAKPSMAGPKSGHAKETSTSSNVASTGTAHTATSEKERAELSAKLRQSISVGARVPPSTSQSSAKDKPVSAAASAANTTTAKLNASAPVSVSATATRPPKASAKETIRSESTRPVASAKRADPVPMSSTSSTGHSLPSSAKPETSISSRLPATTASSDKVAAAPARAAPEQAPAQPRPASNTAIRHDSLTTTRSSAPAAPENSTRVASKTLSKTLSKTQEEPRALEVSSIAHYRDTYDEKNPPVFVAADTWALRCSSAKWIEKHGLVASELSVPDVEALKPSAYLRCEAALRGAIELYGKRLEFLDSGSFRRFGVIDDARLALAIDMRHQYVPDLVEGLTKLVDEQLRKIKRLGLISIGEKVDASFGCVNVQDDALDRAYNWFQQLLPKTRPRARATAAPAAASASSTAKGVVHMSSSLATHDAEADEAPADAGEGPDLVEVFRAIMNMTEIDAVYIVLHRTPKHELHTIAPLLRELLAGRKLVVNVIAFWCRDHSLAMYARDLARLCRGRAHVFDGETAFARVLSEGGAGDDVRIIQGEIAAANQVLQNLVRQTDPGQMKTQTRRAVVNTRPTRSQIIQDLAKSTLLSKKVHQHQENIKEYTRLVDGNGATASGEDQPPLRLSSKQWLASHGIAALNLDFYDVMGKVAFSCSKPGLYLGEKYKSMTKITWKDGTEKTVHLDPAMLVLYRKRLLSLLRVVNERIRWLGTGSRRLFANVCEDVVTLALDVSGAMAPYFPLLKEHIRRQFNEQLRYARFFNVVAFNADAVRWMPEPQPVNQETLEALWSWLDSLFSTIVARKRADERTRIASLEDDYTPPDRNILAGLELACDELRPQLHGQHGIYLLSAGRASQSADEVTTFVKEMLWDGQTRVHCCAYNCMDDVPGVNLLLAIAALSGGRFSLCVEEGTPLDAIHDDVVSWAILSEQDLTHALCASLDASRVVPADAVQRLGRQSRLPRQQPSTYHMLADWLFAKNSASLPFDTSRATLCLSDGDDSMLLREELALGHRYLGMLDAILRALPPDYAQAALSIAKEHDVPFARMPTPNPNDIKESLEEEAKEIQRKPPESCCVLTAAAEPVPEPPKKRVIKPYVAPVATLPPKLNGTSEVRMQLATKRREGSDSKTKELSRKPVTARLDLSNIPQEEEMMDTRSWLREYGLGHFQLRIDQFITSRCVPHRTEVVAATGGTVSAQHCNVFHASIPNSVFKRGGHGNSDQLYHITFPPKEWVKYQKELRKLIARYQQRINWLSSGSRRIFGPVLEKRVCIAIDSSGSMNVHMPFVREQVQALVQEQIRAGCEVFSLMHFNANVYPWTEVLVSVNDDTCMAASHWASSIEAGGGTRLLPVLDVLKSFDDLEAVYLLSDGSPDESTTEVLKVVDETFHGKVKFHTISFDCQNESTNDFLKQLAHRTSGRFLSYKVDENSLESSTGVSNGDDIDRLRKEVSNAQWCIECAAELHNQAVQWMEKQCADRLEHTKLQPVEAKPRWGENSSSLRRAASTSSAPSTTARPSSASSTSSSLINARQTRSSQLRAEHISDVFSSFTALSGQRYTLGADEGDVSGYSAGECADQDAFDDVIEPEEPWSREVHGHLMTATGLVSAPRGQVNGSPRAVPARDWLSPYTVFIKNLPDNCQPAHVEELFRTRLGLKVKGVRLPWDASAGRINGYAYVALDSAEDVQAALYLNGAVMGDCNLVVSVAADRKGATSQSAAGLVAIGSQCA